MDIYQKIETEHVKGKTRLALQDIVAEIPT